MTMMRSLPVALTLACAMAVAIPVIFLVRPPLQLPYSPAQTVTVPSGFTCIAPRSVIPHGLNLKSVYRPGDRTRSVVDPVRQDEYRRGTEAMVRFENDLLQMTNIAYLNLADRDLATQCALDWMDRLATERSLLGDLSPESTPMRHWVLASVASAYMQVRDAGPGAPGQRRRIENWLAAVARTVQNDYPAASKHGRHHNNLMYWAAWSVTATGIALDDRALFNWGIRRARTGIHDIAPDGTLPLEVKRGTRAVLYHQFAVTPLVLIAEAGLKNGINLYDERNGQLHKLAERTITGLIDPDQFSQHAAPGQMVDRDSKPATMAWLVPYNARYPHAGAMALLPVDRAVFSRRMGGNVRALFAPQATDTHAPPPSDP